MERQGHHVCEGETTHPQTGFLKGRDFLLSKRSGGASVDTGPGSKGGASVAFKCEQLAEG